MCASGCIWHTTICMQVQLFPGIHTIVWHINFIINIAARGLQLYQKSPDTGYPVQLYLKSPVPGYLKSPDTRYSYNCYVQIPGTGYNLYPLIITAHNTIVLLPGYPVPVPGYKLYRVQLYPVPGYAHTVTRVLFSLSTGYPGTRVCIPGTRYIRLISSRWPSNHCHKTHNMATLSSAFGKQHAQSRLREWFPCNSPPPGVTVNKFQKTSPHLDRTPGPSTTEVRQMGCGSSKSVQVQKHGIKKVTRIYVMFLLLQFCS